MEKGVRAEESWLESGLGPLVHDRSLILVFPSQAVADAWAEVAPRRFDLEAIERDRFIGWDRFKERLLSAHRSEKPANRISHTIWAADIVARQAEKPFLKRLAGPGKPSPAFVSFFAGLPPSLKRATILPKGARAAALFEADDIFSDLLCLREDYSEFLARHGLFEPGWEDIEALPPREGYVIVAPELMEDFRFHEAALASLAPAVRLLPLPAEKKGTSIVRHENSFEELRSAFLSVGRLLDEGVRPEDIVVTLADFAVAAPYALRAAALAGVPVALKAGSPLSASPFGRLLREIGAAASGGFDFEVLRPLLLDRFLAWKDAQAVRDLVRFGVERHAYASYAVAGRKVDIWEESFKVTQGPRELRDFYRRLKVDLIAIAEAKDFDGLKKAIFAFRGGFLEEEGWTEAERHQVERAMAELASLASAEEELGAAGRLPSPFSLFLASLEATTYVPQGSGGATVAIYPYRVSALHPARHHFVIGASQNGIRVNYPGLAFLREDQKEILGDVSRDASMDFALAYALSAADQRFSYASESFSGWAVAHPFFPGDPVSAPRGDVACPVTAEAAAWRGEAPLPSRVLGFQRSAFLAALPSLEEAAPRFRDSAAGTAAMKAILPRVKAAEGGIRLSATALKEYLACPFSWLLSRALRLEAFETGVDFFDARLAGDMAHAALKRLLEAMDKLGPITPAHLPEYRAEASRAVSAVLPDFAFREGPFLVPMFEAYSPLLVDRLRRLADALVAEPGWMAGELELGLSRAYPELDVVLEGRIDRLGRRMATDGDEYAIVDYKKRYTPKPAELLSTSRLDAKASSAEGKEVALNKGAKGAKSGELGDYQIAVYRALCAAAGKKVERAAYWSIEDAKELIVVGPGGLIAADDCEPEDAALAGAIQEVVGRLRRGDFQPASAGSGACSGCDWKSVCRERYATE
jgi:hypothetical protein